MRRLILVCLLLCGLLPVCAQEADTLALSKSLVAIRIQDPARLLTQMSPLIDLVDDVVRSQAALQPVPEDGQPRPVKTLRASLEEMYAGLQQAPGVDRKGTFWIALLPAALPDKAKDDGDAPPPALRAYVIVPLTNPAALAAALPQAEAMGMQINAIVVGDVAVFSFTGPKPAFKAVKLDLDLRTTRELAAAFQFSQLDLTQFEQAVPPEAGAVLQPFFSLQKEMGENLQRLEVGITMRDADLLIEAYHIPRPDSPLAQQLAHPAAHARDLAALLPANLAYGGVGGAALPGVPGLGQLAGRMGAGLLGMFLEPEQEQSFTARFSALTGLCSQGGAIGLLAPPRYTEGGASLVAVYRIGKAEEAKGIVGAFMKELLAVRAQAMGGAFQETFALEYTPEADTLAGTPVDRVRLTITPEAPPPAGKDEAAPAPPAFTLAGNIAYVGDKMYITAGYESKQQMVELLERLQQGKPGYAQSAQFTQMQAHWPAQVRGFESYAPLDLCRAAVSFLPDAKGKADLQKLLGIFPPQRTSMHSYQEITGGTLHHEMRVPAEQLTFAFTIIKSIMLFAAEDAAKKKAQTHDVPVPGDPTAPAGGH